MELEQWSVDKLTPYDNNPRKNDHAVDRMASGIDEFGFRVPIVAKSNGMIVDGHLRLKAALKLGLTEVPVLIADDMSDAQIKAFRIAVNKLASIAEFDNELLTLEITQLQALDFNIDLLGFDIDELNIITNEPDFEPVTLDEQGQLDTLEPKYVDCPHCGKEFDLREQK